MKITVFDESSLQSLENTYHLEEHLRLERVYKETLRACNIDVFVD